MYVARLARGSAVNLCRSSYTSSTDISGKSDQFRVLDLKKKRQPLRRSTGPPRKSPLLPPRSQQMSVDQDWVSIWPGPRSFHPATVPLPIRQGYPAKEKDAPLSKFANAELMKIPNFLHLTPPAIERHCAAIKKFCSPWPETLSSDEEIEKKLPVVITTTNYCHSSPSIRDPLSRIVTLKIKLSSLTLDKHAKDKLLRLVGPRYDPSTDTITILTDRCPTRKQNADYAHYILTALYHESWKLEPWENEKDWDDMEYYNWSKSVSCKTIMDIGAKKEDLDPDQVTRYSAALTELMDLGEDSVTLNKYKEETKKLLLASAV